MKSTALSLLLATGLATGSVRTVLRVAQYLGRAPLPGAAYASLNKAAMELVAKHAGLSDEHDLSVPSDKVRSNTWLQN